MPETPFGGDPCSVRIIIINTPLYQWRVQDLPHGGASLHFLPIFWEKNMKSTKFWFMGAPVNICHCLSCQRRRYGAITSILMSCMCVCVIFTETHETSFERSRNYV